MEQLLDEERVPMKTDSMFFGLCRETTVLSLEKEVAAEFFKCHCEQRQDQGKAGIYPGPQTLRGSKGFLCGNEFVIISRN